MVGNPHNPSKTIENLKKLKEKREKERDVVIEKRGFGQKSTALGVITAQCFDSLEMQENHEYYSECPSPLLGSNLSSCSSIDKFLPPISPKKGKSKFYQQ